MVRRRVKEEELKAPITVEEALNYDLGEGIYRKVSDLVKEYGNNLIFRVYQEKSDQYTPGYLGEIEGPEIDSFLQGPENFLKENYGAGVFRVVVVNGLNKRFLAHLKISIALSKNINPTPTPQISLDDLNKARKEARQEILELANLAKSPSPNNQPSLDLTKLLELVMTQQEQSRIREEKALEKIRNEENRLREKELALLEKTLSNSTEVGKQFQPMIEFMSQSGKVLSSAMSMIERSANFLHNVTPETPERPFWEHFLIGLGDRLLTSQPQLLDKLIPLIPQMKIPQSPTVPLKTNLTPPIENKSQQNETTPNPEANQFNFDFVFPVILSKYTKRAVRNEDPIFCADSLMADLDDLLQEKWLFEGKSEIRPRATI